MRKTAINICCQFLYGSTGQHNGAKRNCEVVCQSITSDFLLKSIRKYFMNMYKTLQTRYATPVMIWPHCVLCTNLVGIPTTITQQCIQISRKMFEGIIWELLFDFLFTFLKLSDYGTKSSETFPRIINGNSSFY